MYYGDMKVNYTQIFTLALKKNSQAFMLMQVIIIVNVI